MAWRAATARSNTARTIPVMSAANPSQTPALPAGVRALPLNRYPIAREAHDSPIGPDVVAEHPDGPMTVVVDPEPSGTWYELRRHSDGYVMLDWFDIPGQEMVHPADLGGFYARHGMTGVAALVAAHQARMGHRFRPSLADVYGTLDAALSA